MAKMRQRYILYISLFSLLTTTSAWGQTEVIKREKTEAEKKEQLERNRKQAAEKKQRAEEAERIAAEQKAEEMRVKRQQAIADSITKAFQDSVNSEIRKQKHIEELLTEAQNYEKGINGVKKNVYKADSCYVEAANNGSVKAMYDVADMWYRQGIEEDYKSFQKKYYEKAIMWWSKAANECHNDSAQFQLAMCYYHGIGLEDNYTTAWRMLKVLADNGYAKANEFLNSHPYLLDVYKINVEIAAKYMDGFHHYRSIRIRNESTKEVFLIREDDEVGSQLTRTHIWGKVGDVIEFYDTDDSGYRSKTVTIKDNNEVLKVKLQQKIAITTDGPKWMYKKPKTTYK